MAGQTASTATVLATGTLWFLLGGLVRATAALREARSELAELAVADERVRFARDLHDLLGHDLSLIALKAELAGKLLPPGAEAAAGEVDDIKALTRSALARVREAVEGYGRPTLASELAGARVALEAAAIELRVEDRSGTLDPEDRGGLRGRARGRGAGRRPPGGARCLGDHAEARRPQPHRGHPRRRGAGLALTG